MRRALLSTLTIGAAAALVLGVHAPTGTSPLPISVEAEGLLGDVNGDLQIDPVDAFLLLQYHAGIIPSPGGYVVKGDVDENGFSNALDALLILQFNAGLLKGLPPG